MQLTLKGLSKNGSAAFYTGGLWPIRLSVINFPNKKAPETIEVPEGVFVPARVPKSKLTPEERKALKAAQPKLTEAEKIAKAQARLDERKAKLERAASASAGEPAAAEATL